MIEKTSSKGIKLIKRYEGFVSKPYLDSVNVPTIGFGATHYGNGVRVTMQDSPISMERATELLIFMLKEYEDIVKRNVKVLLNQNQFDALVSFVYNLGGANFAKSTLLKKINADPNDLSIKDEFLKWNKAGGKVLNGLTNRRKEEANLYFL